MISSITLGFAPRFGNSGKSASPGNRTPGKQERNPFDEAFERQLRFEEDSFERSGRPNLNRKKTTESMRELEEIPMLDEIDEMKDREIYRYLSPEEREAYRLRIINGDFCNAKGEPLVPPGSRKIADYIYVMTKHRDIFGCPRMNDERLCHSSFAIPEDASDEEAEKPKRKVAGAGQLKVSLKKALLDNSSGHFKPPARILRQSEKILAKEKADMSKIKLLYVYK